MASLVGREPGDELPERVDVVEVAREPERRANRFRALAAAVLNALQESGQRHVVAAEKPSDGAPSHLFDYRLVEKLAAAERISGRIGQVPPSALLLDGVFAYVRGDQTATLN